MMRNQGAQLVKLLGDPCRRSRERVHDDVRKGYVSHAAARKIYGLSEISRT